MRFGLFTLDPLQVAMEPTLDDSETGAGSSVIDAILMYVAHIGRRWGTVGV